MSLLLTTSRSPSKELRAKCRDLSKGLNTKYCSRAESDIDSLIKKARYQGYTSLAILSQKEKTFATRVISINEQGWDESFNAQLTGAAKTKLKTLVDVVEE